MLPGPTLDYGLQLLKCFLVSIVQLDKNNIILLILTFLAKRNQFFFGQLNSILHNSVDGMGMMMKQKQVVIVKVLEYLFSVVHDILRKIVFDKPIKVNRLNFLGLDFLQNIVIKQQLLNLTIFAQKSIQLERRRIYGTTIFRLNFLWFGFNLQLKHISLHIQRQLLIRQNLDKIVKINPDKFSQRFMFVFLQQDKRIFEPKIIILLLIFIDPCDIT